MRLFAASSSVVAARKAETAEGAATKGLVGQHSAVDQDLSSDACWKCGFGLDFLTFIRYPSINLVLHELARTFATVCFERAVRLAESETPPVSASACESAPRKRFWISEASGVLMSSRR
jgi:hypothetical protein